MVNKLEEETEDGLTPYDSDKGYYWRNETHSEPDNITASNGLVSKE